MQGFHQMRMDAHVRWIRRYHSTFVFHSPRRRIRRCRHIVTCRSSSAVTQRAAQGFTKQTRARTNEVSGQTRAATPRERQLLQSYCNTSEVSPPKFEVDLVGAHAVGISPVKTRFRRHRDREGIQLETFHQSPCLIPRATLSSEHWRHVPVSGTSG